jgi:hypothetical protein
MDLDLLKRMLRTVKATRQARPVLTRTGWAPLNKSTPREGALNVRCLFHAHDKVHW